MSYTYTLLRHSAFTVKGDPRFEHAVELHQLTTKLDVESVRKAGGALFHTYLAARDAETAANYPPGVDGLIPRAPGTFSRWRIDGAQIYLPSTDPTALPPVLPTPGNGTSKQKLLEGLTNAFDALSRLESELLAITPVGADYPSGDAVWRRVMLEHARRLTRVERTRQELQAIAEACR